MGLHTDPNTLTKAKLVPMYQDKKPDDTETTCHKNVEKFRLIVNADNEYQQFATCSPKYKVVLHGTLVDCVDKAIGQLNIKYDMKALETNEGARCRTYIDMPDHEYVIGDVTVKLRILFINSYDKTHGVVAKVLAYGYKNNQVGGREYISLDTKSTWYAKHLESLKIEEVTLEIDRAITFFMEKMKQEFSNMLGTVFTMTDAVSFIEEAVKDKVIGKKYLENIKVLIEDTHSINNIWEFYNIISGVITNDIASPDVQMKAQAEMLRRIEKVIAQKYAQQVVTSMQNDSVIQLTG